MQVKLKQMTQKIPRKNDAKNKFYERKKAPKEKISLKKRRKPVGFKISFVWFFSALIATVMPSLSAHYVVAPHTALHFVNAKIGTCIK